MFNKKWIYKFDEIDFSISKFKKGSERSKLRALLGGNSLNLIEMISEKIPVPPGFTITTEACNYYLGSKGVLSNDMRDQIITAISYLEEKTGKDFGCGSNPLLLSVRSGTEYVIPGVIDTILNIGLNGDSLTGLLIQTNNKRFVYDSYGKFIQMFGNLVMGIPIEIFENEIISLKNRKSRKGDGEFTSEELMELINNFRSVFKREVQMEFPENPYDQLILSIEAVFKSWNCNKAVDYRNQFEIPHNSGNAANIVTMVFGNLDENSGIGTVTTRDTSTGEKSVAGSFFRKSQCYNDKDSSKKLDLKKMKTSMPVVYDELHNISQTLEHLFQDMQEIKFTVVNGKLWILQSCSGKRGAKAAVKIAVDLALEGIISKKEAVERVRPEEIDFFLHPQFPPESIENVKKSGKLSGYGLNVSPGAASGVIALDSYTAEKWSREKGEPIILVITETKPDDVAGIHASNGIVAIKGGRTSHAAIVARQFGKPAVVISNLEIDTDMRQISIDKKVLKEGDIISVDGTTGGIFGCELKTEELDFNDENLTTLLSWADDFRHLRVRVNADYPEDAKRAVKYGAEGIGLCRSEHMFFEKERLPLFQKLIMSDNKSEQRALLDELFIFQKDDFTSLFREMDDKPVNIRLIDPPLHEFLPNQTELIYEISDLKLRLKSSKDMNEFDRLFLLIKNKEKILKKIELLKEENPMLGMRGVRVGLHIPELSSMQVRAIFEAACIVHKEGIIVKPEIMIPYVTHVNELKSEKKQLEEVAREILSSKCMEIEYKFGTMIEVPRAALTTDEIAQHASFISFGTNDLTQTTFGISREDGEKGFLIEYMEKGILKENPFTVLDKDGVGALMKTSVTKGRNANKNLECGICGEHGGEPQSISFCHDIGLDYISCSPFRVPVARIAAAQAAIKKGNKA